MGKTSTPRGKRGYVRKLLSKLCRNLINHVLEALSSEVRRLGVKEEAVISYDISMNSIAVVFQLLKTSNEISFR